MARQDKTRQGFLNEEEVMAENTESKIRELSIEAKLLYQRMRTMKPGDTLTYEEMSEIIGRSIQQVRHVLYTARKMAEREDLLTFGTITSEGIRCLNTSEIISTGDTAIRHIHRTARRAARRFNCVGDLNLLPNEEKIRMNTKASVLGVLAHITTAKSLRKIEAPVAQTMEAIPHAKALEVFK